MVFVGKHIVVREVANKHQCIEMVSIYVVLPEAYITELVTFSPPVKVLKSIEPGNYNEP